MSTLTTDAKNKLSTTIRVLRERLLTDLHNAAEVPTGSRCLWRKLAWTKNTE